MVRPLVHLIGLAAVFAMADGQAAARQSVALATVEVSSQMDGVILCAARSGHYVRKGEVLFLIAKGNTNHTERVTAPASGRLLGTTRTGATVVSGGRLATIEPLDQVSFYRQQLRV